MAGILTLPSVAPLRAYRLYSYFSGSVDVSPMTTLKRALLQLKRSSMPAPTPSSDGACTWRDSCLSIRAGGRSSSRSLNSRTICFASAGSILGGLSFFSGSRSSLGFATIRGAERFTSLPARRTATAATAANPAVRTVTAGFVTAGFVTAGFVTAVTAANPAVRTVTAPSRFSSLLDPRALFNAIDMLAGLAGPPPRLPRRTAAPASRRVAVVSAEGILRAVRLPSLATGGTFCGVPLRAL